MDLKQLATTLRILSADMVERAKSGHPGASLGMADIACRKIQNSFWRIIRMFLRI